MPLRSRLTLRTVLIMYLSSCDRKNTLPLLPGEGSSRSAWSPVNHSLQNFSRQHFSVDVTRRV